MTKTILIIDDEPDIREYLIALLEDHGYITHGVTESESIPEAVIRHRPDLIILHIMMPLRSGFSIYKELRSNSHMARIPIALLSGLSPESDFMETGFLQLLEKESIPPPNRFMEKPIDLEALLTLIQELFEDQKGPSYDAH